MLQIPGHVHSIRVEKLGYFQSRLINHITPLLNYAHAHTHACTQTLPQEGWGSFFNFFAESISEPNLKSSILSITSTDRPIGRALHCSTLEIVVVFSLLKFYLEYLDL